MTPSNQTPSQPAEESSNIIQPIQPRPLGGDAVQPISIKSTSPAKKKEELFDAIAPKTASPVMITAAAPKKRLLGPLGVFFLLLLVVVLGAAGYLYKEYNAVKAENDTLKSKGSGATAALGGSPQERFAKHFVVPSGQSIQMTAVETEGQLRQAQQIYPGAKLGDQLVTMSGVLFVYDPLLDTVEAVSPAAAVPVQSITSTQASTTAPTKPLTLDIRNGSGISGLAAKTAADLKQDSQYQVLKTGNASMTDQAQTVVVNLSGKDVAALASKLNAKVVTSLPSGEAQSTADAVVILGRQ